MKSPVVFQSLEQELAPILKYVRGNVLNAGCGDRDLSGFLTKNGAASVENCDIKTAIPGAILADLTRIPRANGVFDAVICNAVLEHVQFPDQVVCELHRVLKPGGYLILCVPFMQPYHPTPADYRRYSKQGLSELARVHNFDVVEIFPVHSLSQTISWIWWTYLGERRKHFQMALLWLPFYLWCCFSRETDFAVKDQANSYQAVLRKTGINGA